MANEVIKSTASQMMQSLDEARQHWLAAVAEGNPMLVAVAEADAKATMLQQIRQQQVAAMLLRFCDPELAMTEIVGNCGDGEKIRCTGLAILSGFVPGRDEYAIFAGKGNSPSKVYVKENGYRKLLGMLPGCQIGDVQVGVPQIETLDGGVEVWSVPGKADCTLDGRKIAVEATGQFAIRLPVKRSRQDNSVIDNVDGIAAKARRRLLQQLWRKASGAGMIDDANEADGIQPHEIEVIDAGPVPQAQPQAAADPDYMQGLTEQERDIVAEWIAEFAGANSMKQLQLAWTAFNAMAKKEQLREGVMTVMTTAKDARKAALGG
jgi:hypothetical protein